VFYVLPDAVLMGLVVQGRINLEIAYTAYYKQRIKESAGDAESIRMKHLGDGVTKYIGSHSRAAFTEFDADTEIIDELDECNQDNIEMGRERLGDSDDPQHVYVANPTFSGRGINAKFKDSDQKYRLFRCRCRSKSGDHTWIKLDWFKNVVKKIENNDFLVLDKDYDPANADSQPRIVCHKCGKPIDRYYGESEWVPKYPEKHISGYQISKLFSSKTTLREMLDLFDKALLNSTKMQRFYNSELGLTYEAQGEKIHESDLDAILGDYSMPDSIDTGASLMGIDVGAYLNILIAKILPGFRLQMVHIGQHPTLESVDNIKLFKNLIRKYNVIIGCIDAKPEISLSKSFCALKNLDNKKRVFYRCHESKIVRDIVDNRRRIISTDRTSLKDDARSLILSQICMLPKNANEIPDFYPQMTAAVRVLNDAKDAYAWEEGSNPDHYHSAFGFLTLCHKLLTKK
jgi:hypothetical protein